MTRSRIIFPIILFIVVTVCFVQASFASENYVGIAEDEEYTWKVDIDEELADDIFEDSEIYEPATSEDAWEENDDFANAKLLSEGDYIMLNYSDDDWYNISLNINDIMEVSIYYAPSQKPIELKLYNSSEKLIAFSNTTSLSYQYCKITANYTGGYYILITNKTLTISIFYNLYIEVDEAPVPHPPPIPYDVLGFFEDFAEDYYDYEGVKYKINTIKEEKSYKLSNNWVKATKVKCDIYGTKDYENLDDWKDEDDYTDFYIVNSDERNYHRYLGLIVADDVDWDYVADDLEKDFEANKYQVDFYNEFESVEAKDEGDGLTIEIVPLKDDIDDFDVILEYDDNGVLEYAELQYGGVSVCIIDLEKPLIEELVDSGMIWVISGVIIAVAAAAVAITTILIIRKRRLGLK